MVIVALQVTGIKKNYFVVQELGCEICGDFAAVCLHRGIVRTTPISLVSDYGNLHLQTGKVFLTDISTTLGIIFRSQNGEKNGEV